MGQWQPPTAPISNEWKPPTEAIDDNSISDPSSEEDQPWMHLSKDEMAAGKLKRLQEANAKPLKASTSWWGGAAKGLDDYLHETGRAMFESGAHPQTASDFLGLMLPSAIKYGNLRSGLSALEEAPKPKFTRSLPQMNGMTLGENKAAMDAAIPALDSRISGIEPYTGPERRISTSPYEGIERRSRHDELLDKFGGRGVVNQPQALDAVEAPQGNTIPLTEPKVNPISKIEPEISTQGVAPAEMGSIAEPPEAHSINSPTTSEILDSDFRRAMLKKETEGMPRDRTHNLTLGRSGLFSDETGSAKFPFADELKNSDFAENLRDSIANEGVVSTVGNTMRTTMATADLSAPLRQGLPLIHKKEFWNNLQPMIRMFSDEGKFTKYMEDIKASPTFRLKEESGLDLTGVPGFNREERFLNPLAEHVPIFGKMVRSSDRAYTGFLTKLRSDTFDSLLKDAEASGYKPREARYLDKVDKDGFIVSQGSVKKPSELSEAIAKYVNAATGRGELWEPLEKSAKELNAVIFSPRLMSSRIHFLNPINYVKAPDFIRKEMLKSMMATAGFATSMAGLSSLAGADVELDPRSADFLKAKFGNTRVDFSGGFSPYLRLFSRVISSSTMNSRGQVKEFNKGYNAPTALDTAYRFMESKEAPLASLVTDWMRGTDFVGNKFNLGTEVGSRFVPMIAQDLYDILKDDPTHAPLIAPGVFGASVQTYEPYKKKPRGLGGLGMPSVRP